MMFFCFAIILAYSAAIMRLVYGFSKISGYDAAGLKPKIRFTVIVPFRNEAENLPALLESLSRLDYPEEMFEVILVDDDSADDFRPLVSGYRFQMIKNSRISNSPKKDAILTAVALAKNDWIITTDADCTVNPGWLLTFDNYIQAENPRMIAGAVNYKCGNSFLHAFQQLDLASLQGATIGSFGLGKPFMCNGANFAYAKSLFEKLHGFAGNDARASGDDVFLLQKAAALFPEKVHYLKARNAIVGTKPLNDWKSLFHQRVRWASKTPAYQSGFGKMLALIVFSGNLIWVLGFGCWALGISGGLLWVFVTLLKFLADYILISMTNGFLTKKTRCFLAGSLLYPFFSTAVALYSLSGKYEWKGRRF